MRISTGISELNLLSREGGRISSEKAYIWPVYDAGKVGQIHGVARRTGPNLAYAKPTPQEHVRLLEKYSGAPSTEYTMHGRLSDKKALTCAPGTFFDALA